MRRGQPRRELDRPARVLGAFLWPIAIEAARGGDDEGRNALGIATERLEGGLERRLLVVAELRFGERDEQLDVVRIRCERTGEERGGLLRAAEPDEHLGALDRFVAHSSR